MARRVRASFAEREHHRTILEEAYAAGRLDDALLEERVTQLEAATFVHELEAVVQDLPAPTSPPPTARPAPSRRRLLTVLLAGGAGALALVWLNRPMLPADPVPVEDPDEPAASGPPPATPTPTSSPVLPDPQQAFTDAVAWASAAGYGPYVEASLYPSQGRVVLDAVTPRRRDVYDTLGFEPGLAGPTIQPEGALPEMTMSEEELTGISVDELLTVSARQFDGTRVTHVIWTTAFIGKQAYVYIEGDAYGKGGGRVVWNLETRTIEHVFPD